MSYRKWLFFVSLFASMAAVARDQSAPLYLVKAMASTQQERSTIANAGIAIDGVLSDAVTFLATDSDIARLKKTGIPYEVSSMPERDWTFPTGDEAFHDYAQTVAELKSIAQQYPNLVSGFSIGKSLEGRNIPGIRISAGHNPDTMPTVIFLGCHHAREHLSVEIPLKLARYLASSYATEERVKKLLDTREVYIVPMVNPDGAEYDIATGNYASWRKNRRDNGDGTRGVDLNRNYAKGFAGEGSSSDTSSDVYHGKSAFSEPETQGVRDFVRGRKKATILLTFHTFSELILWPWGGTKDVISNERDRNVFETMGKKMAEWNHYTPEKSSDLYVASGDTTDWAYDELKMFAFTFEMTPTSIFEGGFYPGAEVIEPTFKANLEPALYMIQHSVNPYEVLSPSADPLKMVE